MCATIGSEVLPRVAGRLWSFVNIEDSNLRPLYLAVFSITVVASIVTTAFFGGCLDCANWLEAVETGTAKGVLHGTAVVSVIEVIQTMILLPSEYVRYKFVEPLKQRLRDEGKEEGKSIGLFEGLAQGEARGEARGQARMHAAIVDWMRRKEDAEREGKEFDEPMPTPDSNGASPRRNGGAERD